jgi:hypothetical protein
MTPLDRNLGATLAELDFGDIATFECFRQRLHAADQWLTFRMPPRFLF